MTREERRNLFDEDIERLVHRADERFAEELLEAGAWGMLDAILHPIAARPAEETVAEAAMVVEETRDAVGRLRAAFVARRNASVHDLSGVKAIAANGELPRSEP